MEIPKPQNRELNMAQSQPDPGEAGMTSTTESGLENDPVILKQKAEQAWKSLEDQMARAKETQSDADIARADELLQEYRALVYKLHPDKDPEKIAEVEEKLKQIKTVYTNTEGDIDNIEISLESNLERFKTFYAEHNIETPNNFESEIRRIWSQNYDKIKQTIEQFGYDDVLFVPPYDTTDINAKTTKDYADTLQTSTFQKKGSFTGITDTKPNTPRIVLLHRKNAENLQRPELAETKNKSIYDLCNATTDAEKEKINELIKNKQPLPIEGLTWAEYLIADRLYLKDTGNHLDNTSSWTWTPNSYSGSSVVRSGWLPGASQVAVSAVDPKDSHSDLGFRPASTFY